MTDQSGKNWQEHRLGNGMRLIYWSAASKVAHLGVFINAGSRDELDNENGLAHFIEHMIFKGTHRRKAYQVISHLENVGGDLNAFTTKEDTCITASYLAEYSPRTFELLADILFASSFPEKELLKEKEVILDEINSYRDDPVEQIVDDFEDQLFNGHSLGRSILGTEDKLRGFDKADIVTFMQANYRADEAVISFVGPTPFRRIVQLAERYFSPCPWPGGEHNRIPVNGYSPSFKEIKRPGYQAHAIIGNRAYPANHPNSLTLSVANNILGGPGMNSRLNMTIRERHGLSYLVESSYQPYSDTGVFEVYMGSDKESIDRVLTLVKREMDKLRNQSLGSLQLHRAKQQYKGQMAILGESNFNVMLSFGKSLMLRMKIETLSEIHARIDAIQPSDILDVSNEIFDPGQRSTLVFRVK